MLFNKNQNTCRLYYYRNFITAGVLLSVHGLPSKEALALKSVEDKEHAGHDRAEHTEQHDEKMEKLFSDESDHADHEKESHTEEGKDEHASHAEQDEDVHAEDNEEGHEEEVLIRLSSDEQKEFGIVLAKAEASSLEQYVDLPGEIVLNADQVAHVVPRVAGIIREVKKKQGDLVRKGEVMAVIESLNVPRDRH